MLNIQLEEYKKEISEQLPPLLKPYENELFSKIKPLIRLWFEPAEETLSSWNSNLNGKPYMPIGTPYPTGKNGSPLRFVAQLNFSELPQLENYPSEGILQFFIDGEDGMYGMFNKNYQVIYHNDIIMDETELIQDFSFMQEIIKNRFVFKKNVPFKIYSKLIFAIPNYNGFVRELPEIYSQFDDDENDELAEILGDLCLSFECHQVGGYHSSAQEDVLSYETDYDTLLFQIDTDDVNDICWGDMGVGNFFIKESRLRNLDFSDVLFHWTCS